jgi:hypothetical protein
VTYCKGLAPGDEPGTWKSCGLEDGHSSPCQVLQQPEAVAEGFMEQSFTSLYQEKARIEAVLATVLNEMDRLTSVSYYEQQAGFTSGVEWAIGELRAAMTRCERRHR